MYVRLKGCAVNQSDWELFTRRGAPRRKDVAAVSIQKQGGFNINRVAYERLGQPDAVELLYNRRQNRVGIRPAAPGVEHSYPIRHQDNSGSFLFSALAFLHHNEIPHIVTRRFNATMEGSMLVVDLNQPTASRDENVV